MARKRSKRDPASPSEEEKEEQVVVVEIDDEGSSSEEEEEHPKTQASTSTQKTPPAKKSAASTAAQSDESDSGSESDSDSDSPPPQVKPIATKPMEENLEKSRSKSLASVPVKASSRKRASESEQGPKQAKRAKKKAGEEGTGGGGAVAEEGKKTGEDAKKPLFQRVFTEDDEIALLLGMLDYHAEKGVDPFADMSAFYDYVKKSLHTEVTQPQVADKVKRLKKRYEKNFGKGKLEEEKTFSKAHDGNVFDLSKKIWGKEGIIGKNEKKVDGGEAMDIEKKGSDSGVCLFDKKNGGVGGLEEEILKHGLEKVGVEKKAALEGRWRKLQIAELEMSVERYVLMADHGKALLEVYKSEEK